tara:strand:+ start:291 stop:410 length:120 start_codon:yes stop_codon:yes gene_type:complete
VLPESHLLPGSTAEDLLQAMGALHDQKGNLLHTNGASDL